MQHSRDKLLLHWKFHDVVVCTTRKCFGLCRRMFLSAQHNDRRVCERLFRAVARDEIHSITIRHHQILQDHTRSQRLRASNCIERVRAHFDAGIAHAVKQASHTLTDDRLIINDEHHELFTQERCLHLRLPHSCVLSVSNLRPIASSDGSFDCESLQAPSDG